MSKFIKSLLACVLVFPIIYAIVVGFVGWIPFKNLNYKLGAYGHLYTRVREIPSVGSIDILFLGSSHSYRAFDPRIFSKSGIKTFNLGSSSQTPLQADILLRKYFEILKPKMVIYEVSPLTFSNDGVESSLDLIANDEISNATLEMAVKLNHVKTYNSLLYGIIRQALNFGQFKEPRKMDKDTYITGGYVEREKSYYHATKSGLPRPDNSVPPILNQLQILKFKEIIDFLKQKNVKVLLVQTPVTSEFYSSQSANNSNFDNLIKESKVDYLDFNRITALDDSLHFYDKHHLNQDGVEIFDEKLIKLLPR